MTQPAPPDTIGLDPQTADDVNRQVGTHLRQFVEIKETIGHDQDWLSGADLGAAPYYFDSSQQTDIKTAIATLNTALDAVDMTFINRLTGLF